MRLRELPGTAATIRALLAHCRDRWIAPYLGTVEDYDGFAEALLGAEFHGAEYAPNNHEWSVGFTGLPAYRGDTHILFLFARDKDALGNIILVELSYGMQGGFIRVQLDDDRHPPMAQDFLCGGRIVVPGKEGSGELGVAVDGDVMGVEELELYLVGETVRKDSIWI